MYEDEAVAAMSGSAGEQRAFDIDCLGRERELRADDYQAGDSCSEINMLVLIATKEVFECLP